MIPLYDFIDGLKGEIADLKRQLAERDNRIVALGQCRANSALHEMRVECVDWKWVKNTSVADDVQQRVDEAVQAEAEWWAARVKLMRGDAGFSMYELERLAAHRSRTEDKPEGK